MKRMKAIRSVIFFMVILAFGLSQESSIILAEESTPTYSVTISMNEREVYGSQRVNISFSILGMGDIDSGFVTVTSDTDNILVNEFGVIASVLLGSETISSAEFEFPPIEGIEIKATSTGIPIVSVEVPTGARLHMYGWVTIDTNGTSSGSHRLKVTFLAQSNNENYLFEDSIEYRIIGFFEAYPIYQYLIPAGISFVTTVIVLAITEYLRRRKRKNEDTASKT